MKNFEASNSGSMIASPTESCYRVGTLTYTKAGLVTLFAWLLWGDFCFTLMETVIPSVLPLKLKALDAPNWLMGLMITTIPSAINFCINPIVSFRSDRYRSKWGRRIPFLLFATPFLTLFLILMGFSQEIGEFTHRLISTWITRFSPTTFVLIWIGVFMIGFQFFNMFIASVYYYLFNDVVPHAYLARCMALFRVVGSAVGSMYSYFIYQYAGTHMREIFLGAGLLYFITFTLMCLKVKEGQYPPPPPNVGGKSGIRAAAETYLRECFFCRFYWYFFLSNACWGVSWAIGIFNVFLLRDSLGLNLNQLGKIGGIAGIVSTVLLYPAGILSDRFHPLRVMLVANILLLLIAPVGLIYLVHDFRPDQVLLITIVTTCVSIPMSVMYSAAQLPMYMSILPTERYGQFGSADAMVRSICAIMGGVLAGAYMDCFRWLYDGKVFYYRFIPFWHIFWQSLALVFLILLYRQWQRLGGKSGYQPPATGVDQIPGS
ncbi:MAG: MFS transporter [Phycisphaerae bacterium]